MRMNEKQQLVVLIVVFSVALVGEGVFAYSCFKKRSELHAALTKLDREEAEAKRKRDLIPALQANARELAQIIEDYAEILPTRAEVGLDAFLEDIEEFMQGTSLVMITGAPVQEKRKRADKNAPTNNFDQHKYKFQLEGTYLEFVKFINRVENHTRFLEILEIKISPSSETSGGRATDGAQEIRLAENPRKRIEVTISTYTYSKPVADAVAGKAKK